MAAVGVKTMLRKLMLDEQMICYFGDTKIIFVSINETGFKIIPLQAPGDAACQFDFTKRFIDTLLEWLHRSSILI